MQVVEDMTLLQEYAHRNSESAFAALVSRHVNFVYSSALRQVRDPHLAQEITQAVFIILARKAASISRQTVLTGWLFKTVRFTASAQLKAARRRQRREQEAQMNSAMMEASPDKTWESMSPLLDEALAKLNDQDRQAVLLRYFENKSLSQVGGALAVSEDTARKRVGRAVEKLRQFFVKRGVALSALSISGALSANAVQAAPIGLAASVSAAAVKGSAVTASTLTLVKGALKLMSLAKLKLAAAAGTVAILAVGATIAVEHARSSNTTAVELSTRTEVEETSSTSLAANSERSPAAVPGRTAPRAAGALSTGEIDDSAWDQTDTRVLASLPPALILRPTHFPTPNGGMAWQSTPTGEIKMIARAMAFDRLAAAIFDVPSYQLALPPDAPTNRFDVLLTVPGGTKAMLQEEIRKQFGLVAVRETREGDVLVVKVKTPDAPGLKRSEQDTGTGNAGGGGGGFGSAGSQSSSSQFVKSPQAGKTAPKVGSRYYATDQSINGLIRSLQGHFDLPLYDETGLSGHYDISIEWSAANGLTGSAAVQAAILEQLGLELTPGRAEIEMLVLRKE
jgi:uncharacterized protein (TIGR03435 family)